MNDLSLCHPRLQLLAARLIEECNRQNLKIKIGETLRTVEEQDALYAQGRTKPGLIVTNAPGSSYSSYHQWGTAFDFYRNDGAGPYNDTGKFFDRVGAIGTALGLEWGGNWKNPVDKPHFQLPDWGSSTAGIKKLYSNPPVFMKTWVPADDRNGWIKNGSSWCYRRPDGSYPVNKWCVIRRHWYLFNGYGHMCTGWHRWNGKECDSEDGSGDWYYLDQTKGGPSEGSCWHSRDNGVQEIWLVNMEDSI